MVGDLPANVEQTLLAKLAEQISLDIDFELLYGQMIEINGEKYILYNSRHMVKHPKYPYIKIKCELKNK